MSLAERLPADGSSEAALDAFLDWTAERGLELYPAQEEAILTLFDGTHVVLETPTGSGKSLVALALHFRELAAKRRSFYTAPIKALVAEKYRDLVGHFGPDAVGLMTGDGSVNRDALIICCTAEILAKMAVRHGEELDLAAVVMDEFHYYGDRDRGMAWQVPLLTLPQVRFLLMSATLGPTAHIREDLEARTGIEAAWVASAERPVPLEFEYRSVQVDQSLDALVRGGSAPVYAVHFTQREAAARAQALLSSDFCTPEEKAEIRVAVGKFRFDEKGTLMRTMAFLDVKEIDEKLVPMTMRLTPADKDGEFTQITYDELEFDVDISKSTFTLQALKR